MVCVVGKSCIWVASEDARLSRLVYIKATPLYSMVQIHMRTRRRQHYALLLQAEMYSCTIHNKNKCVVLPESYVVSYPDIFNTEYVQ